ncbi:hypothetical protein [uncultured Thiodictyon sp.]|jgi:PAS domain-containing protein|uniref:hypothetical protein n=1 Tax=uncultured Thiodictyon sp. TaxID=1846217 RepID=UPI0025D0CF2D|nr:hypothetical protein [uncultured Thiodictyon sp.]
MDGLDNNQEQPMSIEQARQQTEMRLRVTEARCRLLAKNALDVIWTMSLDGRTTYVSPSVERLRERTDDALYAAKAGGRNRVCLFAWEAG